MSKPTVFLSHASEDEAVLRRLKEHFDRKTAGTLDIFLSSDGQSIPLGRNWVHRIEEALESSALMLLFVTPRSLGSRWIPFEAGFAYSRKVRVVPIGLGVDLSTIAAPLSLLQGFNLHDADGLNNLIALVNEAFGVSHDLSFTAEEWNDIALHGAARGQHLLGHFAERVREVTIRWPAPYEQGAASITKLLEERGLEHVADRASVESYGLSLESKSIHREGTRVEECFLRLAPEGLVETLSLAEGIHRELAPETTEPPWMTFWLVAGWEQPAEGPQLTSRARACGLRLHGKSARHFGFEGVELWFPDDDGIDEGLWLSLGIAGQRLVELPLGRLLDALFANDFYRASTVSP